MRSASSPPERMLCAWESVSEASRAISFQSFFCSADLGLQATHWCSPCTPCGMAYQQNSRTLVATFNDYNTAEKAARELESNGVPHDSVHVDASNTSGSTTGT